MKSFNDWERKRNQEIREFTEGWSWERVFETWLERLSDFSVSIVPFFTEIQIHDPELPIDNDIHIQSYVPSWDMMWIYEKDYFRSNEYPKLSWWQTNSVFTLHKQLQDHLDRYPGTIGPIHPYNFRKGEIETLYYLWEYRQEPEKIAAILIAASLFSRLKSRRTTYPDKNWPPKHCVNVLWHWAYDKWSEEKTNCGWNDLCTEVLPEENADYVYKFDNMYALVRFLAEEHALLLINYRPITIQFKSERDPSIEKVLWEEREAAKKQAEEKRQKEEQQKAQKAKEEELHRQEHPRWGEWYKISDDELAQLVWSEPIKNIAKIFGVSDASVSNKCRKAGIRKPPRGFWAKVEAGKIPHPQGKPPR